MTVSDLIARLKTFAPNARVWLRGTDDDVEDLTLVSGARMFEGNESAFESTREAIPPNGDYDVLIE